jgi:extracellular factor (EF) 3-hydroxypalmitic acid methyl ester biosynthesis protein
LLNQHAHHALVEFRPFGTNFRKYIRHQRDKPVREAGWEAKMSVFISSTSEHSDTPVRNVIHRFDKQHDTLPDMNLTFIEDIAQKLSSAVASSDAVSNVLRRLVTECEKLRYHLPTDEWKRRVKMIRESKLLPLVHQDPFTYRAFTKPRGYAGDAVMMDFIYSQEENWQRPEASELGQCVFQYTVNSAASAGVRSRREFIAECLDEVARTHVAPTALAIACGHLREASMSSAVRRRRFKNFIALDSDADSLKEVDRSYSRYGVSTHLADIRKMLTGRLDYGKFDLIYSTGLYDYLNPKTAKRLTGHLFSMLQPGGKLVIANFLPTMGDIGYMEACMDWFLIYRDRFAMMGLTELIDQSDIHEVRISVEENQSIIFLEVIRS